MSVKFNLQNLDAFSQESLTVINSSQSAQKLPFYICRVKEPPQEFLFEGSSFCEYFLRNKNSDNGKFTNPLTRCEITLFECYKSVRETDLFTKVFDQDSMSPPRYLPVLYNDFRRPSEERGEFYNRMGECYLVGRDCEVNRDEALHYFRCGANFGHKNSQHNVITLLHDKGLEFENEYFYWLLKCASGSDASNRDLTECALSFEKKKALPNNQNYAFLFYKKGAIKGNPYCIAKVIKYYEKADIEKAVLWRQFIPQEWQHKNIQSYMGYICQDPSLLDITKHLTIAPELLEDEILLDANPDYLFPEMKVKVDILVKEPTFTP